MSARDDLIAYLIATAINSYNSQFNTSFIATDFILIKIPTQANWALAYETFNESNPSFRLRVYMSVGAYDTLSAFTQELDSSFGINKLGDEIMVAYGTLSTGRIKNMGFNIKQWGIESSVSNVFITEDFNFIMTEDGNNLALEKN